MKTLIPKLLFAGLAFVASCGFIPLVQPTASAQTLTLSNRWSFSEPLGSTTVTDSVSGANGTVLGQAQVDGAGNLVLNGSNGIPAYVALPGGLISSISNVTIEAWVTNASTPDNVCLFAFDDGTGNGTLGNGSWNGQDFRMVLHDHGNTENFMQFDGVSNPSSPSFGNGSVGSPTGFGNLPILHIVCVYDPVGGTAAIYTNGLLEVSLSSTNLAPLSRVPINESAIGQSPWWNFNGGDPWLTGQISEFRIWSGAFTYSNAVASFLAGPNTVNITHVPLTIVDQPIPPALPLSPGNSLTLSVLAFSSSQPITYQWAKGPVGGPYVNLTDGTLGDGAVISGSTSNVLTISNLTTAEGTNYVVKLSDSAPANLTSSNATVAVVAAPVLTPTTPSFITNYTTKSSEFDATCSGSQPITLHWQVSTDGGLTYSDVNDVNVSGATTTNLVFNNLQLSEAGLYRLRASNVSGSATNTPGSLTVLNITNALYNWFTPVAYTNFPSPAADEILDGPTGIFFEAEGGSGGSPTIVTTTSGKTYTFQSDASSSTWTGGSGPQNFGFLGGYTSGNANLDSVLGNAYFDGGTHGIVLHNLTLGLKYSAQLFGIDDRGGNVSARRSNYQDPANPQDKSATFTMGAGVYIIGTFIATNADMTIQQNLLDEGGSGNLSGVVVRILRPTLSVQPAGSNVQVSWDYGTLLQATSITGPWTTNIATPPSLTVTPSIAGPHMYFRVQAP